MAKFILVFIVLSILLSSTIAAVPSFIKICGRHDPNINECIKESVSQLKKKLLLGIPELNVPSMETLEIDKVIIADIPDFRTIATNMKLRGISDFVIKNLNVNLESQIIDIEVTFPKLYNDSDYDVEAKIVMPIKEKVPISIVTVNVVAKISLQMKILNRRGRHYVYFPKMTLALIIPDFVADYNPGPNPSPVSELIKTVLKGNKQEILQTMTPNLEKALSAKILNIVNQICKNYTYDELFPDRT